MTFVITPDGKAFEFKFGSSIAFTIKTSTKNCEPIKYYVEYAGIQISPDITVCYEEFDPKDKQDAIDYAYVAAVEWLRDFLIRLHDEPAVIECESDGEIFTYGRGN